MEINAAVFRKVREPLTIEAVEIDKPWGREVLVRTVATGVCHSDLHVVDGIGRFPLDRPIVLGHEGAGVVEMVGADVTTVKPGDHVVACLSGFCGACPQCLSGHPNLCTGGLVTRPDSAAPRLSQHGQPLRQFIGISSYAEKMLLHENSIVRINPELPLDRAALVGCGVLTGVGAALRSSGLEAGQSVAVFGCGGVGLSIIQGARIGGARQIIAVDQFDFEARDGDPRRRHRFCQQRRGRPGQTGARVDRRARCRSRLRGGRRRRAGAPGDREPGDPRHRDDRRRLAAGRDDRVPMDGDPPRMQGADLAHGLEPVSAPTSRSISTSTARAASTSTQWSPSAAVSATSTKPSAP